MSADHVGWTSGAPRLRYTISGAGEPVLFVMGFSMRGAAWRPQVEGLSPRWRTITFDARGIGDSDPVQGPLTMQTMADDAVRVLDAVGEETAHLVGVSMGGMVAQVLAAGRPDRWRSLTLISTHGGGMITWLPTLRGLRHMIGAQLGGRGRLGHLERLLYPPAYRASCDRDALEHRMRTSFADPPPQATLTAQLAAVTQHRAPEALYSTPLSTLVMWADEDILIPPRHTEALAQRIRGARTHVLKGAGHGLIFQGAAELNAALESHFVGATEVVS